MINGSNENYNKAYYDDNSDKDNDNDNNNKANTNGNSRNTYDIGNTNDLGANDDID